jgi:hypothetical protein
MKALVPSGIKLQPQPEYSNVLCGTTYLEKLTLTQPFFRQFPFLRHAVHLIIQEGVIGELRD